MTTRNPMRAFFSQGNRVNGRNRLLAVKSERERSTPAPPPVVGQFDCGGYSESDQLICDPCDCRDSQNINHILEGFDKRVPALRI